MIAEIIPYTRTPRGTHFFDYLIPEEIENDIRIGSVVQITFRKKKRYGLVKRIKTDSPVPEERLHQLLSIHPYTRWTHPRQVAYLEWFAEYYGISLPTAWKTIQYPLLQRPRKSSRKEVVAPLMTPQSQEIHTSVLPAFQTIVQSQAHILARYNNRRDILGLYQYLTEQQDGNVLIIVPEYTQAAEIAAVLPPTAVWMHEKPSKSDIYLLEQELAEPDSQKIVITTKRLAHLYPGLFSLIILDQEEAKSHKQYDQNPRYHVRTCILQQLERYYEHENEHTPSPRIICTSHAPSISLAHHAQEQSDWEYIDFSRPWNADHIRLINMEEEKKKQNYTWFSEELISTIQHSPRILLFLNRTGTFAASLCSDCDELVPSAALSCPSCGGSRIHPIRKGIQALEQELASLFPHKKIIRIDASQDISAEEIQKYHIVVATEKLFRVIPLHFFHNIGVLSVDHLLVYPHFQSQERVFSLLTQLAIAGVPLLLQTHSPRHPIIQHAISNNWSVFSTSELSVRKMLQLPPFAPYVQLLDTSSREVRQAEGNEDIAELPQQIVVNRFD